MRTVAGIPLTCSVSLSLLLGFANMVNGKPVLQQIVLREQLNQQYGRELLTYPIGITDSCVYAEEPATGLSIQVDRVVYAPGAHGQAKLKIPGSQETEGLIVKSALEFGLTRKHKLPDVKVQDLKDGTVLIPFSVPIDAWGCTFRVELFRGTTHLASAYDVFAVGFNPFRLVRCSSLPCFDGRP